MSEQATKARGARKTRTGVVTSDKMQKSIVVQVSRRVKHPVYGKYVTKTRRFVAHDEGNEARPGDRVTIEETRPVSRRKRWRLKQIIARAEQLPSLGKQSGAAS